MWRSLLRKHRVGERESIKWRRLSAKQLSILFVRRALRLRLRDKPVGVRHNIGEVGWIPASRGGFQHHTAQGRRAADAQKPQPQFEPGRHGMRDPVDPSCPFLFHTLKAISRPFSRRFPPFFARFHRLAEAVPTSPKLEPRAKKRRHKGPRGGAGSGKPGLSRTCQG